ncbi:LacI family DNA-binding transcriptional regulator [Ruania alkalisoli]|uniref:LacI family DNA-binding transcriptional regulator n=1 Tax=Ruania alkalisoli TaxID=2779775 RepID=A0A7M1SP22_9MICO|nr:LacI family DNA-binding transcriptional regulator [Ruania alkalisoli]
MSPVNDGRRRPVTLKEVAAKAGVSVSAVSLVANEKKNARIGEATRARVLQAIEDLGYRPNALAKNLVHGQSRFIGLVADAIASTPFAGQIIHGAQVEAWRRGYVLLVANSEGNAEAEAQAISMLLEHKVHGILYSTWYHRQIDLPAGLSEAETVLVNCFADDGPLAVVPDEFDGGRAAAQLLIDAGHERIAFINTVTPSPAREGRLAGYRAALADAGIEVDPALVLDADSAQEGGYASVEAVLASGATAVCCHNDRVAMGLYDGLRERGLRIPADLSVVGFDNQEIIAAHLRPGLSTVALPHYELGVAGVRALLDGGPEASDRLTIACPPVVRESVRSLA